jgi:hypothetical protein
MLKTIAGIDPDLSLSGLAILDVTTNTWLVHAAVQNCDIVEIIQKHCDPDTTEIILECGWLNAKANFRFGSNKRVSDRISKNVGENQATGKLILSMLKKAGYKVTEQAPLQKGPLKENGKWTELGRAFIVRVSGITARINDEVRDAVYLITAKKGNIIHRKS